MGTHSLKGIRTALETKDEAASPVGSNGEREPRGEDHQEPEDGEADQKDNGNGGNRDRLGAAGLEVRASGSEDEEHGYLLAVQVHR